jgi:hypothetical protein
MKLDDPHGPNRLLLIGWSGQSVRDTFHDKPCVQENHGVRRIQVDARRVLGCIDDCERVAATQAILRRFWRRGAAHANAGRGGFEPSFNT